MSTSREPKVRRLVHEFLTDKLGISTDKAKNLGASIMKSWRKENGLSAKRKPGRIFVPRWSDGVLHAHLQEDEDNRAPGILRDFLKRKGKDPDKWRLTKKAPNRRPGYLTYTLRKRRTKKKPRVTEEELRQMEEDKKKDKRKPFQELSPNQAKILLSSIMENRTVTASTTTN